MKTIVLTAFALLAFAGNSVLCRLALGESLIDPAGFTAIRLIAGAITLAFICIIILNNKGQKLSLFKPSIKQVKGSILLFIYAISFSFAYVVLETGAGALILFGSVQLTLFISSFLVGNRPRFVEWLGLMVSFSGLLYLLLPTWGTPNLFGFVLMVISGVAWGLYTLAGKGSTYPLIDTCRNFNGCLPLIIVLSLFTFQLNMWSSYGMLLAVISGALTSGVGYAVWYTVLPHLSVVQAGVLQLLVPILAAIGGIVFVSEALTAQLLIAALLVLGGVYLVTVVGK